MSQTILHTALLVRDYDEAIAYYQGVLGFDLIEDIDQVEQDKRWVTVAPANSNGASILLAKPSNDEQKKFIGCQAGGRVSFFLHTENFWEDYENYISRGVNFLEKPREEAYGTVVVFSDLYGNKWDLLQLSLNHINRSRLNHV